MNKVNGRVHHSRFGASTLFFNTVKQIEWVWVALRREFRGAIYRRRSKMEVFETINWAIIAPILVIQLILLVTALIDLTRIEKTNGPKWVWALVIIFVNIIGPILYFVLGRRND
jgi:hypothetical protein